MTLLLLGFAASGVLTLMAAWGGRDLFVSRDADVSWWRGHSGR